MTLQNIKISKRNTNSKEILLLLLKNSLGDRLAKLEHNNKRENNNLFSMKEASNNMIFFLKESSQKINIISKNKYSIKTENNIKNTFSKTSKNFYNNKIIRKIESPFSPIKSKQLNSKEKALTNKIIIKKKISRTPLNSPLPKQKNKNIRKISNLTNNINLDNKSEISNSKPNENKTEKNKKNQDVTNFKTNNNGLLVTKQNSIISNNKNKDKIVLSNTNRTITSLSLRNKKIKKKAKLNDMTNLLTVKKKKNLNKENDIKSKTINNFYPKNKAIINNENKDLSNIKRELDLLCENDLFYNDIRLNELKLEDFKEPKTEIKLSKQDNLGRKLSLIGQSILNNKDELLTLYKKNQVPITNKFCKKYSFDENLETCLEYLIEYLSVKDLFNLALINKEYYKTIIRYLTTKTETKLERIKNKINDLIKRYKTININIKETTKFECNYNSSRAIVLLNSIPNGSLFKPNSQLIYNKEIIFILELFFISIGKKQDLLKYENNNSKKWNFMCKYFKDNDMPIGKIIEKELLNKKFSNEIINSLYEWSYRNINKITPNYYQNINKDIAIFVFVIKDLLDFLGISKEKRVVPQKLYILNNIRKSVQEKLCKNLNKLVDKME